MVGLNVEFALGRSSDGYSLPGRVRLNGLPHARRAIDSSRLENGRSESSDGHDD
jgi:hypothetical protein